VREKLISAVKNKWFWLGAGIVIGALAILAIRFFTYEPPKETHYHANFAVYINGQQEKFQNKQYYEEVQMCVLKGPTKPEARAHMHDGVYDVAHVEDEAATWGHFFTNLGWTIGGNFIQTRDGTMYVTQDQNKLYVQLNGQDYTGFGSIANMVIKNEDRLLISYGDIDKATLQKQYDAIPATAKKYNSTKDPSTCGGDTEGSFKDRIRHLL
jgi:hypothetical protein